METRAEIFNGHALLLRPGVRKDGKWAVWLNERNIAEISKLPTDTSRYLLELRYSADGYTLIDDFGSLDEAWEILKNYIIYFKLL